MHDADTFEGLDLVAESCTHAADLVLFSFSDGEIKLLLITWTHDCCRWLRAVAFDIDSRRHNREEHPGDGLVDSDLVFFLVEGGRIKQWAREAAVIGEDHESLGVFVEAADRTDVRDTEVLFEARGDVDLMFGGGVGDDPATLVVGEVGLLRGFADHLDLVCGSDLLPE